MEELLVQIDALIGAAARDIDQIERTLTDGYAHALSLEAERWRIKRRMHEVAHALNGDDTTTKTRELTSLAARLDGNAGDLTKLRSLLADLRRHAETVRN
ncbi:MAG TPA: hypothetical protein VFJ78_08965 [Gaiellaceae bacterium]|nr:hypothetical protein [Gaiellaceae bacterium]